MDQLIPIVNRLQDVFSAVGMPNVIELPQIVVVGAQSSGKSSVLESLVGKDFLPRGVGIVTRRPLILQLKTIPMGEKPAEWAEFLHAPGHKFDDFDEVRREIERDTERVTGRNKGISSQPIGLRVYSPYVLDLTLVDLPGITKVPVGDQPQDIESQIRRMLMQYITNPNSIILAVTSANTDLANSDALKLARDVDPEGNRTIGVVTKIDLMDQGTDALETLQGKIYPLRRGYVGVICRSQKDIHARKPIKEALKAEEQFFRNHASYRHMANRLGSQFLAKTLNNILMYHIRDCLPDMKTRIMSLLAEKEQELVSYGDPMLDSKRSQGALLLHLLSKFARNFADTIDGRSTENTTTELMGGARMSFIFHDVFGRVLAEVDPLDGLSDQEIRTAIRNATGPRPALFVPEISFELLVKKQIQRLEEPSLQCVDLVFEELQRVVQQCEIAEMVRFGRLRERIVEVVGQVLRRCLGPTNQMISNLIAIELAYINTNHPDFIGGSKAISSIQQNAQSPQPQLIPVSAYEQPPPPSEKPSRRPPAQGSALHQQQQQQQQQQQDGGFFGAIFGSKKKDQRIEQHMAGMSIEEQQQYGGMDMIPPPPPPPGTGGPMAGQYGQQQQQMGHHRRGYSSPVVHGQYHSNANTMVKLPQVPSSMKPDELPTERERVETQIIKSLLSSYFNIVRKNVSDCVPKSIMYFLVNTAKDVLQRELVSQLYREELFDDLLRETDDIAGRRKSCIDLIDTLRKALDIVNQVTLAVVMCFQIRKLRTMVFCRFAISTCSTRSCDRLNV
eukprot:GILK01002369.1.p1 GENE.GILK01002369.1~~GILK01002369.1.p1  ORF type:complete len:787 (-),score=132.68 GILK01002369.1:482-2842(-)